MHAHTSKTGDENISKIHLFKKKLIYFASNIIYSHFSTRVACSTLAADFMFGTDKNIEVLYNGIDFSRFKESSKLNRDRYGICINARFDMQKNPFFIVDILYELISIDNRYHAEWIGTGHLYQDVLSQIVDYGIEDNIKLLGTCENVEQILGRNSIFLLPSLYEGLGIVVIESQISDMYCFVSNEIPEIADLGRMEIISLDRSAKDWAQYIIECCSKPLAELDKVKANRYELESTVRRLTKLYDDVVNT